MMIQTITRNQPLESSFRSFARRRVQYAMGKFGNEVHAVRVIFDDLNGPRGGLDQECRIEVQTRRGSLIVATVTGETSGFALDGAIRRVTRRLRDHLNRRQRNSRAVVNEVLEATDVA